LPGWDAGLLIAATIEILVVVMVRIIVILIVLGAVIVHVDAAAQKGGRRYSKGKKQDALHDKTTDA
jgi:hypothetical protein